MEEMLLLQIFSGLPKKSALRCEAVCKRWQSLVKESASSFTASNARSIHRRDYGSLVLRDEFGRKALSLFNHRGSCVDKHTIHSKSLFGPLRRYASFRNPVVFYSRKLNGLRQFSYHVYNPITRHHIDIPPITTNFKDGPYPSCLGYAPCSSEEGSHFKLVVFSAHKSYLFSIFDSETREWKTEQTSKLSIFDSETRVWKTEQPAIFSAHKSYLFSIFYSETREWKTEQPKLSIFDSETGIWKTEQPKMSIESQTGIWKTEQQDRLDDFRDFGERCTPCLFIDGDLFWLRYRFILVFRLKTWTARRIELPPPPPPHHRRIVDPPPYGCFWESDRRLKYSEIPHNPLEFCVWVLDEPLVSDGGNKWRKVFSLSKDSLYSIFIRAGSKPYPYDTEVSAFDEDEGIIHLETPRGLLSYDISKKRVTRISEYRYSEGELLGHQPFTCNKLNSPLNSPGIGRLSRKRKSKYITSHVSKFRKYYDF